MGIRVYLTGRVCLEADGYLVVEEREFRGRQSRLLFAYLVSKRNRTVPKDELAKILWADELPRAWEISLSSLVSGLRALLTIGPLSSLGVDVSRGSGQYQLMLPSDTWVDLEAGATAIDEAEGALRANEPQRLLGPATVAVNIARRPFLAGIEGDWVESQRRKQERNHLRALDCLTEMWLARDEPALAAEMAIEAVELDQFRESSYRRLMRAYRAGGNRAQALSVYHRLRRLLAGELGTGPSPETDAVYKQLLG